MVMEKKYYIIKNVVLLFLLIFGSVFISISTKGFKNDLLIENNGFTYIPFVCIHLLILSSMFIYDYKKEKNIKELITYIISFILLAILVIIGILNSKLDVRYSFRLIYVGLQIVTLFITLVSLIKCAKLFSTNFLED